MRINESIFESAQSFNYGSYLINCNRQRSKTLCIRSVSYTHLDVYKRQTVVRPEWLYANECLALSYNLDKLEILERRIIGKY